jgi:hypothetical protein
MKLLFYNILLLVAMLMANQSMAQNQKLYRFSLKGTGQFVTLSQGALTMADERTGVNNLVQYFIVERRSNGKTLITPAAKPGLFLKRNGAAVELAAYITDDTSFEWDIRYSGYPYASLAKPGANDVLNWQTGSGFSMQVPGAGLTNNTDGSGDSYRFGISPITNTF